MKKLLSRLKRKKGTTENTVERSDQRLVVDFLSGKFLTRDKVLVFLPYILFLGLLGIVYIANGYLAESAFMRMDKLNREVKDLRSEYITIKSELNYRSKQSSVAEMVEELGLKESVEPPKKIVKQEEE